MLDSSSTAKNESENLKTGWRFGGCLWSKGKKNHHKKAEICGSSEKFHPCTAPALWRFEPHDGRPTASLEILVWIKGHGMSELYVMVQDFLTLVSYEKLNLCIECNLYQLKENDVDFFLQMWQCQNVKNTPKATRYKITKYEFFSINL